jgi:hypothetical protein
MNAKHEIEVHREDALPAPATESAAIFSMIERAARDPSVDLDKMERLMRMRKDMMAEQAERAFNLAMKSAQSEMRPVAADAVNPQTRSKYATYAKLDRELRPIYTRNGFSLSFDEADSPKEDHIRVVCYLSHEDGHTRTYHKDMPADGKGAKGGDVMTKIHATGAASSYGARYILKGVFNIAVGEDDSDGNEPTAKISANQVTEIRELLEAKGGDVRKLCEYFDITGLADIPAAKFARVKAAIMKKGQRND